MNYKLFGFIIAACMLLGGIPFSYYCYKTKPNAELLIKNGTVITMNPARNIIQDGAVVIRGDSIIAVGPTDKLTQQYTAAKTIDAQGGAILPGFINGHAHTAMSLLRGVSDDTALEEWLQHHIFPLEKKYASPDFVYWGTMLGCLEMLQSGVTTLVDMYLYEDAAARAFDAMGIRAIAGYGIVSQEDLDHAQIFIKKWHTHKLVTPAPAPHSPYATSTQILIDAKKIADLYQLPITSHVAETATEVATIQKKYGKRPVEYLASIGFLGKNLIAAHVIQVNDQEIDLLKQHGVGIIHNPTSNMKLASGIADVTTMLKKGLLVGLGTDSAASNNALSMLAEIKLAALLQKVSTHDARALSAETALELATIRGAQAIHKEHEIGSLEVGKKADIIIISLKHLHQKPIYNIISQIVYASEASDIDTVIINGKLLMHQRAFTYPAAQIESIHAHANSYAARIRNDLTVR